MTAPRNPIEALASLVPRQLNPVRQLKVAGRLVRRAMKKPGTSPGTVEYTGAPRAEPPRMSALRFDPSGAKDEAWADLPGDLAVPAPGPGVLWVEVDGIHDVKLLERIGKAMGFHPLVLEDIASVGQRPKLEEYPDHLYIVVHMLGVGPTGRVTDEQVSIVMGQGFLFLFQETPGDVFEPVRQRIRSGRGRIRSGGADYLAYAIIDALVDSYFHVLERLGNTAEDLETQVIEGPTDRVMEAVHHLRRELLVVRRSIWPLRDLLAAFLRCEGGLVQESTKVFLRDVHDHCYQLIDTVEILRDVTAGTRELHLSNVSHRTNEVMKLLTIMASIFIPLTFVVGVYGMNFEYMPELTWRWGYPGIWVFMIAMTVGMLWYFRRKRWI